MRGSTGVVAIAMAPVLAFVGLLAFVVIASEEPPQPGCGSAGPAVQVAAAGQPAGEVSAGGATYRGEQLVNAAHVIRAGADAGVGAHGQTIGVMTAIGESTLINVDYGDKVGPDSRGLFQQRALGWGTYEQRMDPYQAATSFFRALIQVPGWETLAPTIAAHRTQRNADPFHYERFWDDAVGLVEALSDGTVSVSGPCTAAAGPNSPVGAGGVVRPVVGPVTSGFGARWGGQHLGLDFGAPTDTRIDAAKAGRVVLVCLTNTSPCTGYGTLIGIDHGGGEVTRYAHACRDDVLVAVGDVVEAGQQIARVDSCGQSTGPHLHFEVHRNGRAIDPAPWLTGAGVIL